MKKTLKGLFAGLVVAAAPALADAPYVGAVPGEPGAHRRPATTATQQPAIGQQPIGQTATNPLLAQPVSPQAPSGAQTGMQAGARGEYQIIPVGGRLAPCTDLAAQFGVNWTRDEGRGFQQDGVVGCEYKAIPGAHGAPAAMPVGIYNLTRGENAATFARMIDQASNRHSIAPLSPQEQRQLMQGGHTTRYGMPYNHNPALPLPPVGINGYVPNHGTPQINFHFRYPR